MENRVLFRGIRVNGNHGTKPCTFWQKCILRGKSENHGTKVGGGYIFYTILYYSAEKIKCTGQWIFMSLSKADSP